MMTGTVGILNVGAGDVELNFNSKDPADRLRAGKIVKDMLRRGFALLVEVERDGEKKFERAFDFDEFTSRYIIADFEAEREAETAMRRRKEEKEYGESVPPETTAAAPSPGENVRKKRGRSKLTVDAKSTRAIGVGRSAGG